MTSLKFYAVPALILSVWVGVAAGTIHHLGRFSLSSQAARSIKSPPPPPAPKTLVSMR